MAGGGFAHAAVDPAGAAIRLPGSGGGGGARRAGSHGEASLRLRRGRFVSCHLRLGFSSPSAPTGVWASPDPDWMCAVAGGYAYLIDTSEPRRWEQLEYRPVTEIRAAARSRLLVFASFHSLLAWGPGGKAWQTARFSWEGVRITGIEGDTLIGLGWELRTDRELEFAVNLKTGEHRGGGYLL